MEDIQLLNPNFFFLQDNYPTLYDECKEMDLAIVNEKYNDSVILSAGILESLVKIITKSDDEDLDKLIDRVCKLNSTASEIGLYLKDIRINSQKAIENPKRFSKSKSLKNAEMVYEVTSYFLYTGVSPLESYSAPHYYDNWVKKEIADIRAREEYEYDLQDKVDEISSQKVLDDFTSQKKKDIIKSQSLKKEKSSSKKIVIKVKTEKTPVIRLIMREDMLDEFKPVIDIDYIDD